MRFTVLLLLPFAIGLMSCGDKSAVTLSGNVSNPAIQVRDTAFGAALSGSFELQLALGPEASGSTTVTLGNFSLQSEAGEPLLDVLRVESTTDFPLVIEKGGSETARFTFREDTVERAAVCMGRVKIVGSVLDSLKGATDPVSSLSFAPDCGAAP